MPSDNSYAERLQHFKNLMGTIGGFTPAFTPTDVTLIPATLNAALLVVDTGNDIINTKSGTYTTGSKNRVDSVKTIKTLSGQAMAYLRSNRAWKSYTATAKETYRKLRGYRAAKIKAPVSPTGNTTTDTAAKATRDSGNQSYADLANLFQKFIGILSSAPGYAPPDAGISVASLTALQAALEQSNTDLGTLEGDLSQRQKARFAIYFEKETGLNAQFQAVKAAVQGQYKAASSQYQAVKGVRF